MKTAEIYKYELNPRRAEGYPLEWEKIYDRKAPLAVEIGCGNGEYLVLWARSRPEWNFVGIDLSLTSVERTLENIYRHKVINVRAIHDDARFALRELFPDDSLHMVVSNFPDPWPKERHRQRRTVVPSFIQTLSAVLEPGGVFELTSDQEWYVGEAAALFRESDLFRVEEIEKNPHRPFSTKYEKKWRTRQRDIFRLRAFKIRNAPVTCLLENSEMPHFIIEKTHLPSSRIFQLKGVSEKGEGSMFVIKEVFATQDRQAYLLRTVATDQDFYQSFYLIVAPHRQGHIVKLDATIQPYRTPAVKTAVRRVGELLKQE